MRSAPLRPAPLLALLASLSLLPLVGCEVAQSWRAPQGGLQRMIEQPRYDAFEESHFFADGLTMRHPPAGTVPFGVAVPTGVLATGLTPEGAFSLELPVELTPALLERGRERYDIVCATCHGVAGTSDTPVARNMPLRPPPALVEAPVSRYPPGRVYRAVSEGYGLMPSYRSHLPSAEERWAVVAYVMALARSQNAMLADVPDEARATLTGGAP